VAVSHGPASYVLPALAYRLEGGDAFDRLWALRIGSALMSALAVLFVFGTLRELIPSARWPAVAGALLVAFQPMWGFMSGTVNADIGVNLAGSALLYLLVRVLRRGLTARRFAAIAVVVVLGVLAKGTMFAFVPALLAALAILAWRHRATLRVRLSPRVVAAFAIPGAVAFAAAAGAMDALGRPLFVAPNGAGPVEAGVSPSGVLSYVWQFYLPKLPFMSDIFTAPDSPAFTVYIRRGFGAFGWLSVNLPSWALYVIAATIFALVVLAVRTVLIRRDAVRERAPELAVLALAFMCVAAFSHIAFVRVNPSGEILEQGRYLFPAATSAAVFAVGACYGLGRRWAPVAATVLVTAMMVLSGLSQLFVLTSYYA
jgi:4-amino-4-deoxy-L-arabinose transferase-like glycosyltransferase